MHIRHIDSDLVGAGVRHSEYSSPDGFCQNGFCKRCNNEKTGGRYGDAYTDFVDQFGASGLLERRDSRLYVQLRGVYPLRVLKQMMAMLIAAQPRRAGPAGTDTLRQFVLHRDAKLSPEAPQVYLYRNISAQGRIVPWCGVSELFTNRRVVVCSEISWPPVGIVFALERDDRLAAMANITHWGSYEFHDRADFILSVPGLEVRTDWALGFGSAREVELWTRKAGVVWFVGETDDPDIPTSTSMTWRRLIA